MAAPPRRLAILGAGPIGLEAALHAVRAGFNVRLLEQGGIGANVAHWGHVRMFSPFAMNSSSAGRAALVPSCRAKRDGAPERTLPAADDYLTGRDFVEQYLLPLSQLPELAPRIHQHTTVLSITRSQLLKRDLIGQPQRQRDPFRLLVRDAAGQESLHFADLIFDCTGTYPHHNWLGAGGGPCPGERAAGDRIDYTLPDILGQDRGRFLNQRTLVVGQGYSAATAVVQLAQLVPQAPQTRILWVTRRETSPPFPLLPDDPLPGRRELCAAANRLAASTGQGVRHLPGRLVREISYRPDRDKLLVVFDQVHGLSVRDQDAQTSEQLTVDRIIAAVGYRPQRTLHEELQIHECYASQGPIKLAAALLGQTSGDCLQQPRQGASVLRNPEPGYYILGAKSYGRDPRFLIQIGLQQIQDVLTELAAPSPP